MPIGRKRYDVVMKFVVDWANDVPWKNWWSLLQEEHGWGDDDSDADYTWIMVTNADGKQTPYLKDPLQGGRLSLLDHTTYMDTTAHHVSDKSSIDLALYDLKE